MPSWVNSIPQASIDAIPLILKPDVDFSPFLPSFLYFFDPHIKDPRVQQFNFTIQRQLPGEVAFQVGYVGSVANFLQQGIDQNAPRFIPGNDAKGNPLSTFGNGNQRRPNQDFTLQLHTQSRANSAYHSLQVQAQKRFAKGLSFLSAYTWAKAIDFNADINGSEWAIGLY